LSSRYNSWPLPASGLTGTIQLSQPDTHSGCESQLPAVAENDFFKPIEANFGGLNVGGQKVLNTLIYQYFYGNLR
jgi:hypothetical protein